MDFDGGIFSTRFGTGLPRTSSEARTPDEMLSALGAADTIAQSYPVGTFEYVRNRFKERAAYAELLKVNEPDLTQEEIGRKARRKYAFRSGNWAAFKAHMARWVETNDPLRERLMLFWADHFTVRGDDSRYKHAEPFYLEEAIRPNLTGRFEDMLVACATHPIMVRYLDQHRSTSPLSEFGRRFDKGLNENLAREVLELHSLGVDGPYTQDDVRALAQLLAGLTVDRHHTTRYSLRRAHPRPIHFLDRDYGSGWIKILGRDYGAGKPDFEELLAALRDLANHPATARHMARKLAVHFVSDDPSDALVDAIEARWRDSGGQLMDVYSALLTHPEAANATRAKVKQPFELIATSFKALGVRGQEIMDFPDKAILDLRRWMVGLGQRWLRPQGPDGWPEESGAWITPIGLSLRFQFMLGFLSVYENRVEPRDVLERGLGPLASRELRFAIGAAESRVDALALILLSPEFQRK